MSKFKPETVEKNSIKGPVPGLNLDSHLKLNRVRTPPGSPGKPWIFILVGNM